jgi:ribosomal-protein-alanine N-acetyltransferase
MKLDSNVDYADEVVRLFLLTPQHVGPEYLAWMNDPAINQFLESRFSTHGIEDLRAFVTSKLESANALMLGIYDLALDRHVGNIKLEPIDLRHGLAEIGIMIGSVEAHGRGIATHAINLIANIAKNELQIRKLTAGCYGSNRASMRAFQKAGFEIEAERRDHVVVEGKLESMILMARFVSS